MATQGMGLDEFLGHSAGSVTRGNFLKKWRKGDPPKILVWLHLSIGLGFARWSHNWPRIVVREDRDTGEPRREVWGGQWVCHENELVLRKQRFRDDDDEREVPPVTCPMCLAIEAVRRMVREGELDWTTPIFKFKGSDSEHDTVIHAGGIYNAFGRRDLSVEEKGELRKAGIRPSEAWRENATARCQYTFAIVDNDHPEDGVQITDEAEALGNAMKSVLRDKLEEVGIEKGNPLRNPYPFLWEYREAESFEKKYRVVPKTMIECTDEIRELISAPPPDLSSHLAPGNIATLRTDMEQACLIDNFPFDEVFGPAEKAAGEAKKAAGDDDGADDDADFDPEKLEGDDDAEGEEGAEELYVCDVCDFDEMKESDTQCPKCGACYDEEGEVESRPCAKCKSQIMLAEQVQGDKAICAECGAIHSVADWSVAEPAKKATKRRSAKSTKAGKPALRGKATADPSDDLPWGK